jgi:ubiquinone biosynthesis protein UbiJ
VAHARIELTRGSAKEPDAIVETDPCTLAALVYGGRKLAEAVRCGDLAYTGDRNAVARFLALFTLPQPASANHSRTSTGRA